MAIQREEKPLECTWPSHVDWMEIMDDGHHMWGDIRLPLLHQLVRRAEQIVNGALTFQRWQLEGEPYEIWMDLCKFNKPLLELEGEIKTGLGYSYHVEWWIRFDELGDPGSHGFSGPWIAPEFALASLIAHCEEHHRQELEKNLTVTGGIA